MISPAEIPAIYLLGAGIILLLIGYFLGEIIQSIEDGLWLIAIRFAGYFVMVYLVLRSVFGFAPF